MLFETTRAFFRSAGWPVEAAPGQPLLRTRYRAGDAEWVVYAVADDAQHQLVVFSVLPESAPEPRRAAIAELFMRIDFALPVGGFELDMTDGTMRFRTGFDFDGVEPTTAMVRNLVLPNVAAVEHFRGAIAKVLAGASPADALP